MNKTFKKIIYDIMEHLLNKLDELADEVNNKKTMVYVDFIDQVIIQKIKSYYIVRDKDANDVLLKATKNRDKVEYFLYEYYQLFVIYIVSK